MSNFEVVRIVDGRPHWSCDRCVIDRDGKLIAAYSDSVDEGGSDPILRGVVKAGFGDRVWVPLDSSEFMADDYIEVVGPSRLSAVGIFALGWLGGYLAWVGIGKYQARQEMKRSEMVFRKMNSKVPYKPRESPHWYNFPGEKK